MVLHPSHGSLILNLHGGGAGSLNRLLTNFNKCATPARNDVSCLCRRPRFRSGIQTWMNGKLVVENAGRRKFVLFSRCYTPFVWNSRQTPEILPTSVFFSCPQQESCPRPDAHMRKPALHHSILGQSGFMRHSMSKLCVLEMPCGLWYCMLGMICYAFGI